MAAAQGMWVFCRAVCAVLTLCLIDPLVVGSLAVILLAAQPKWERVEAAKVQSLQGGGEARIAKQHEKVGGGCPDSRQPCWRWCSSGMLQL